MGTEIASYTPQIKPVAPISAQRNSSLMHSIYDFAIANNKGRSSFHEFAAGNRAISRWYTEVPDNKAARRASDSAANARPAQVSGSKDMHGHSAQAGRFLTVSRLGLINAPHMETTGDWVYALDSKGRVKQVTARHLKLKPGASVPQGGVNNPTKAPKSWAFLQSPPKNFIKIPLKKSAFKKALTSKGKAPKSKAKKGKPTPAVSSFPLTTYFPYYRRMHMLNGRLGGPGNDLANLAPGSQGLNSAHSKHFEDPAIELISNGLELSLYEVSVDYNKPSSVLKSTAARAAWRDCIWEIWGHFEYVDSAGVNQVGDFNAEEDSPGLDTKNFWKGH